jgi:hypothetical protein
VLFSNGSRDNSLVRVVGNLREYDSRVHVLVYDVVPIDDWNELTHHLLEVILTHLHATKGPIVSSSAAHSASFSCT